MIATAIFVATLLVFAFLSSAAGWPNPTSGWTIAVGVALGLALLRVIGPLLDYLREAGGKFETPFLKLDFAGAARATVISGQPWLLSDDLIRKSPSVPESGMVNWSEVHKVSLVNQRSCLTLRTVELGTQPGFSQLQPLRL